MIKWQNHYFGIPNEKTDSAKDHKMDETIRWKDDEDCYKGSYYRLSPPKHPNQP